MEVVIAWSPHHSLLLHHCLLQFGAVDVHVPEKMLQAYTALQIMIFLTRSYFEVIIVVVRLEYFGNKKSGTQFVLQE